MTAGTFSDAAASQAQDRHNATADAAAREIAAAQARDTWRRENDHALTPDALRDRAAAAARWAIPGLSDAEVDDLASEVALNVRRRLGTWTPRSSDVPRKLLSLRAVTLWRDRRRAIADTLDADRLDAPPAHADASDGTPAHDRRDFMAAALGAQLPAADVDWRAVATALGAVEGTGAADAVMAALSGYKSGTDLGAVLGLSDDAAWQRLSRGRAAIRKRYPTPDALVAQLLNADAADRPLIPDTPDRLRLDCLRRVLRDALDSMGLTTATAPTVGKLPERTRGEDGVPAPTPHGPVVGGHVAQARHAARQDAAAARATTTGPTRHARPDRTARRPDGTWAHYHPAAVSDEHRRTAPQGAAWAHAVAPTVPGPAAAMTRDRQRERIAAAVAAAIG